MKDNKHKVCSVFNLGALYRFPIYSSMDKILNCDFYIGTFSESSIKTFDYNLLMGFKGYIKNHFWGPICWKTGVMKLLFKPYDTYIMTGEIRDISQYIFLIFAKLMGKRTIAWTHGMTHGPSSRLANFIRRIYYNLWSDVLTYNEFAIEKMKENGIKVNMRCLANSMDSHYIKKLRNQIQCSDVFTLHFHNNNPVIIFCGRLTKEKRLDLLIDAVKNISDQGVNINVVIVGKESKDNYLTQKINNSGISDRVWMYGPCYDDAVLGELFYNADVCVSPGNVGLTAIHALSFGCPTISHSDYSCQGPEFEAIKPGLTGDFFKKDDINDMTCVINNWIGLPMEKRNKIREACYNEIDSKWNIDYQIKVLQEVLGK